jgi:hypothetical protein
MVDRLRPLVPLVRPLLLVILAAILILFGLPAILVDAAP